MWRGQVKIPLFRKSGPVFGSTLKKSRTSSLCMAVSWAEVSKFLALQVLGDEERLGHVRREIRPLEDCRHLAVIRREDAVYPVLLLHVLQLVDFTSSHHDREAAPYLLVLLR